MNDHVEVQPYNSSWPDWFKKEAVLIKEALGSNCKTVYHIGSTSVPGLSAKPIIDILPIVKEIKKVDEAVPNMEKLGYISKGEFGIAFRHYFQKGHNPRTHNVHIFEKGNPEISRYLKFRDWMIAHSEDARAYSQLKRQLAEKFPTDMLKYCFGKDAFVADIDVKTGYQGWRMVQALTDREWETAHRLCLQNPLYPINLADKESIHFAFYKESTIIGYANLKLSFPVEATLNLLVIDQHYRQQGWGSLFLKLCERWLTYQGVKRVYIHPLLESFPFFQKRGYRSLSSDHFDKKELVTVQMIKKI